MYAFICYEQVFNSQHDFHKLCPALWSFSFMDILLTIHIITMEMVKNSIESEMSRVATVINAQGNVEDSDALFTTVVGFDWTSTSGVFLLSKLCIQ